MDFEFSYIGEGPLSISLSKTMVSEMKRAAEMDFIEESCET
jgi:hypothetical protein